MINFCQICGHPTEKRIPELDHLLRDVCTHCGYIHYQNPKIVCGALVTHHDQVLLCRRAIEPSYGLWTLPAGYMEIGESIQQGAMRECWEEAEAKIDIEQLYCIYNMFHIGQVHLLFKSQLHQGKFGSGVESLECALFYEHEIPWQELAFPSVENTLKHYFQDRQHQHFPLHIENFDQHILTQFYAKRNKPTEQNN